MKTLIEKLKEDLTLARSQGDTKAVNLSKVLIGECERLSKDLPNDKVLGVVQKTLKGLKSLNEARFSSDTVEEIKLLEQWIMNVYSDYPELRPQEIDLDAIISQLITDNPGQAASLQEKPQNIGWFVGQVMKATQGKANPTIVKDKILDRL
jgi:Glu-tRNA(Gln) amidotransferase subunit E-like FAD-binding protein